jgi:hypothetical protein
MVFSQKPQLWYKIANRKFKDTPLPARHNFPYNTNGVEIKALNWNVIV